MKIHSLYICCFYLSIPFLTRVLSAQNGSSQVLIPVIDGNFWQVAGNPDLGELTGENQQPVDFAIWQAEDSTWQLWSCIRGTRCGGHHRLFYSWEGKDLESCNWEPVGITMMADTMLGESPGSLQAPYVINENGSFYMFYGDWRRICLAVSKNGKDFTRVLKKEDGEPVLFSEHVHEPPPFNHARDPMVLKSENTYYCYYINPANP